MKRTYYTKEQKMAFISSYWSMKADDPGWTFRKHANLNNVFYHTARNWYYSQEYNDKCGVRLSGRKGKTPVAKMGPSDDQPFVFIGEV